MNPPLSTHLAMIDVALRPFADDLASSFKSFNSVTIFLRDKHYKDNATAIATALARPHDKRNDFVLHHIEGRRVDLHASALGETFHSHTAKLHKSRLNPTSHLVWGIYVELAHRTEAVVQVTFEKASGASPNSSTISKLWSAHKDEIIHSLTPLAGYDTPSLADELRALPPTTPNAFVVKWDIANSSQAVHNDYGDFRHFMTMFTYAVNALVAHHNGKVTAHSGSGESIVMYLPESVDPNNTKAIARFASTSVMPLIEKIERSHETLAIHYQPQPCLNVALGLGYVEISQHDLATGPVFWEIDARLKTLGTSGNFYNLVYTRDAKAAIA